MNKAEALAASREHWAENTAAETPEEASLGIRSCALCSLFYYDGCDGCPVAERTGQKDCYESPYYDAADAHRAWLFDPANPAKAEAFRSAARKELDFLKSLQQEETTE